MILNKRKIKEIISDIKMDFMSPNRFEVYGKGDGFLIQFQSWMIDRDTNVPSWQKGGKHYISKYAIETEVVFKALKACLDFAEHEIRESFTYRGVAISNPHTDVERLLEFQATKPLAARKDVEMINETELTNI